MHVCMCAVEPVRLFVRLCYGCAPACLWLCAASYIAPVRPCLLASRVRSSRSRSWPSRERFCARCVTKKKPETVAVSEGGRRSGELCETGAPPAAVCSCAEVLRVVPLAQAAPNVRSSPGANQRKGSRVSVANSGPCRCVASWRFGCGQWAAALRSMA